jgi:hypothetical protein
MGAIDHGFPKEHGQMTIGESSYDRINDYASVKISLGSAARYPQLVVWRGEKARNDQLSDLPARERWLVL